MDLMQYLGKIARAQLERQRISVGTPEEREQIDEALSKLSRFTTPPPQQTLKVLAEKVDGRLGDLLRVFGIVAALVSLWAWAVFQFY